MLSAALIVCLSLVSDPLAVEAGAALDKPAVMAADAEAPRSRIREVVVFPKHAEITRELTVDAVAGHNRVVFSNLLQALDAQTVRASVGGEGRITGTELRTVYLEQSLSEEIAALDQTLVSLQDERTAIQRAIERVDERAAFHGSIRERVAADMERGFAEGSLAVDDWQRVLTFVADGLAACDIERAELETRRRDVEATLAARTAERKAYAQHQPVQTQLVEVSFDAPRPGPVAVRLHTMVEAAVWKPSYDVHLDRATGEIEITGYGQIVQWSGEPWEDVQLTLAMSRPDTELSVPDLTPMVASLDDSEMKQLAHEVTFVSSSGREQVESWSTGRFKRRQDRETFRRNLEQLARQTDKTLARYGLSRDIVEGALSRLTDRFSGVRYVIERPATVPFDGSSHKVATFQARVPASLRWVATPALGDTVMLQGSVTNSTGFPILEGAASLFLDDSYVGVTALEGAAQNEGLSFGFGPDDGLQVHRRLVTRKVQGPEAFRQSQVITFEYELVVENFHDRAVTLDIADQIPISKTSEIQVSFKQATEQPSVDADTGVLGWTLDVDAGSSRNLRYRFSVECPVGRDVHWS